MSVWRIYLVWLGARLSEKQSQVAIAGLIGGVSMTLSANHMVSGWAEPLLPLIALALQNVFTPEAVAHKEAAPPVVTDIDIKTGPVVPANGG